MGNCRFNKCKSKPLREYACTVIINNRASEILLFNRGSLLKVSSLDRELWHGIFYSYPMSLFVKGKYIIKYHSNLES
jgi:hypothetical protein